MAVPTSTALYRDYSPVHPMARSDYARGTNLLLETAKSVYGAVQTECGFLYCAIVGRCLARSCIDLLPGPRYSTP
jgi:hypothetical protein